MNYRRHSALRGLIVLIVLCQPLVGRAQQQQGALPASPAWPEVTQTARPWTRWWWHGSAVDAPNLTRLLEAYHAAGLGGVEITCIYGVKGNEQRNRAYLSEAWVEAVKHTLQEAKRLGMGVDLPAGSGWRMGGPSVLPKDANSRVEIASETVAAGDAYTKQFSRSTPQSALAISKDGRRIDLSDQITGSALEWRAPDGDWTVYTLAYRWSGDRVKRPGPGGEGLNINPFSAPSVEHFLAYFGKTLDQLPGLRAQFHDSFEYDGNWQPEFLEAFAARRGYRLEDQLPALAGDGPQDTVERVKSDYRETLADLVLENLVEPWAAWAHRHGQLARNQSHGSPANWLDLYAAVDIPETESFGRLQGGDADPLVLKFASSAANVAGKKLVSSESATWLDEHFNVTLAQLKQIVDRLMLAGVNHVFYHGTAYSPADAPWPGWLFYASTQLNPQNPIWRDFPTLNTYVTRCQSVLQDSSPDNDVLLYWPLHDAWHTTKGLRMEVRVHNGGDWFYGRPLGDAAVLLDEHGYAFDYVSDRGLASCAARGRRIKAPGGTYSAVVVPRAQHMPLATLMRLAELADGGATVLFWGGLPTSQPGMAGAQPNAEWDAVSQKIRALAAKGRVRIGDDVPAMLRAAGVRNEHQLRDLGLVFLRKKWNGSSVYFLRNKRDTRFDGWAPLAASFTSAAIMDPMSGKVGLAQVQGTAKRGSSLRLQLAAGQSVLVCASNNDLKTDEWPYRQPAGASSTLAGPWRVRFLTGGPNLPEGFESDGPKPWTEAPDQSAQSFAGTVSYAASFDAPQSAGPRILLDLGEVLGSARVRVNGEEVATLIAPPFEVELNELLPRGNKLEVEVTGVAANRIRDLDRRGVVWRVFEDINLVNIDYKPFDASVWPVRPLGLTGPVTLTPLRATQQ
ncbi:hypothetical protein Pla175_31800 [Pirellulimonas nuda]|uniref:Glycosyl hydrolases family 2, sugar binding domain n=1 Tax=Pirellulimonas nuda TaxID=2528009 RepID=A0A518DE75_9BACT|nr:glycosyl hydrolase [Pirellulimonas nuda]QDU89785.1 hypothetical protein Pla175_31800 [Pirellulimonas nuda]